MSQSIRDSFFEKQTASALWDVAVCLKRGNALPLDADSIFPSEEALNTYRNGGGPAYPGQVVSIVEENQTKICYLDQNLEVKPVGIIPSGDDKTISVNEDGQISLLVDDSEAEDGAYLTITEEGTLKWVVLDKSDIAALETTIYGSDDTEGLVDKIGVKADADKEIEATGLYKIIDDEFARADAAEKALGARIDELDKKEDKDTTYSVKEGEKVLSLDGTTFGTTLSIAYDNNEIKLLGINDEVISSFDASAFTADGVLENVEYDTETKDLTFTWNIITGETEDGTPVYKTDVINVADLIDTYTAGSGLNLVDNEFSVKVPTTDPYLTVDATGVHTKGIDDAIANAIADLPTEDTNTTYALGVNGATITLTPSEGVAQSKTLDVYTKSETDTKIDEKIASVTGGESAADVKLSLETYRDAINAEIWGEDAKNWTTTEEVDGKTVVKYTPAYGTPSRVDDLTSRVETLENAGYEENKIDTITTAPDAKITVSKSGKTITLDDSDLQLLISNAQSKANDAFTKGENALAGVAANTLLINNNSTNIGLLQEQSGINTQAIADLRQHDTDHTVQFNTLNSTVQEHGTAIATLSSGKADVSITNGLADSISKQEQAIKTINETTIPGLAAEVDKKIDKTDVYTTGKIDEKIAEINKAIEDSSKADAASIKANADAIANIYIAASNDDEGNEIPASGVLLDLVAAEESRAKKVETDFEGRIAEMEKFWDVADDPAGTIDKLAEIVDYIEKHEDLDIPASVEANTKAIENIYTAANGETPASGVLVNEIAAAKTYADTAASNAVKGIPAATAQALGLVKVDNYTIVAKDGVISVAKVTTDMLVNGDNELILCGGNATVVATNPPAEV